MRKGLDYLVDLGIFYFGFIALSIFWLHERTRDYNILIKRIEVIERNNQELESYLSKLNAKFELTRLNETVEGNDDRQRVLRDRVQSLQSSINLIDKYL